MREREMEMVTYANAVSGKVESNTLASALAYAEMLWDACGIRLAITDAEGMPVAYRFDCYGTAVAL